MLSVGPVAELATRIGKYWWTLLLLGVAWIVVGFVVLRFDTSTVTVVSVLFGLLLLLAGAAELGRAALTPGGWRVWHAFFAVVCLVAAAIAFANPGGTFESLALVTGLYFVVAGTFDVASSLFSAAALPGWWVQLLAGLAEVVLGFIASSSYRASVFVLVTFVAVSALFRGMAEIGIAFAVRSTLTETS